MDTATRKRLLAEAETWKGTPFHHKGRIKGVGVDCGGFVYCVYSQFANVPPFPKNYEEDWALHRDGYELYLDYVQPLTIEVDQPDLADVALFKFGRCYSHAAIYMGEGKFIHAYGRTRHGCVQVSRRGAFNIHYKGVRPVRFFSLRQELWRL